MRTLTGPTSLASLATAAALAFGAAPALATPGDDATVKTATFTLSFTNDGGATADCETG